MGYIYKITNKVNGKVYIGQTVKPIEKRWQEHQRGKDYYGRSEYNTHLKKAFRKYGLNNFIVEQVEKCPDSKLSERECYWIKYYDSFNNGYNSTLGGEQGYTCDTEEILKLWNKGYNCREIAKRLNMSVDGRAISNRLKANGISQEEIYKRGYKKSSQSSARPVLQYDLEGNFIAKYKSMMDAARAVKCDRSGISKVCAGVQHTAGGYKWMYEGDNKKFAPHNMRSVLQYDLKGNLVQRYKSITEAAKETNNLAVNIQQACRKNIISHGYKWKYEDEVK